MDEYWAKIKDNITCALCYELFNHTNRLPKGLPCLHSFCLSCLTTYVSKAYEEGNALLCPLCKKKFTILSNESVNDLPTNPAIMNNVGIFPANKEESNIPVCENHGNKQFIFLCTDCNTGLCKFCITNLKDGPHANHSLEDYSTAFQELRKNVNKTQNQIEKYAMDLVDVHSILKEKVEEASQKEIESIIEREQEAIAKAKEWRKHMIKDIESKKEVQLLAITTKYYSLKENLDEMIEHLNKAKPLLDSNDCDAFTVYKDLEEHETLPILNEELVKFSKNTNEKIFVSSTLESFGMLVPDIIHTWEGAPTGRTGAAGPYASIPTSNTATPASASSTGQSRAPPAMNELSHPFLLNNLKHARQYNPKYFNLNPKGARYFVIKAYYKDDILSSIRHSIWCSTEHGNKRLNSAFRERECKGPVYLLYSETGSGHFCGIAQMMSVVDWSSSSSLWARNTWKGQFEVIWIYVKDVPNSQLRHIRLENNENKPVTNSRDCQEVPPEKGKQVLEIIHHYPHTTSIFDNSSQLEGMMSQQVE